MTPEIISLSRPIRLGSAALPHNIIVSPMVGVTDAPFRRLCARGGSALMSGEMLSAQAIRYGNKKTLNLLRFFPDERPLSSQLMGSDPLIMAEAAKIVESYGADVIDINAGCPVPKITKTKSGAALLKDEGRLAAILNAVVAAVRVPVTVKIRIGVRENEYLAPALAKLAQECGVAAVIVHARPVSKRHSGRPDWEGLRQTVVAVKIPVIGNGGVNVPQDAEDFLKISGCAGVSLGRAAIGDPGIFDRIRHYLTTGEELPPPTQRDKLETLWQHVQWAADFFGEKTGLLRLRKSSLTMSRDFRMPLIFEREPTALRLSWSGKNLLKTRTKHFFKDLGFAKPEPHRIYRQGFPEAIYCPGKTGKQIEHIFRELLRGPGPVIATRVTPNVAQSLLARFPDANYYGTARLVVAKPMKQRGRKPIGILTGGTADLPFAEEAAVTAVSLGCPVIRLYDVGVAGIHRLMAHRETLSKVKVAVVCAGMDGALPSVVGGLVRCPVIAIPTSVGYGTHYKGIAPLLTMLNSCAANVSVVNIDNGFGAGVIASLIVK